LARNKAGIKLSHAEGRKGYTHNPKSAGKGQYSISNDELFVEKSKHTNEYIKNRILTEKLLDYKCSECGINSWCGKKLVLELDHINGVNNDNRLTNLRLLCPNCHSQTDTFRGRGNTGKMKVSDQQMLDAYRKCANIRQALLDVGLAAKGGNYTRMMKLISKQDEI
jgi:5-methylcytosine-specific restriction endonuclease McrA